MAKIILPAKQAKRGFRVGDLVIVSGDTLFIICDVTLDESRYVYDATRLRDGAHFKGQALTSAYLLQGPATLENEAS